MKHKFKIKPTPIPEGGRIVPTDISEIANELIKFSFKYLDLKNSKFSIDTKETKYFISKLQRFRDISGWKVKEFFANPNKTLRNHSINWSETTERGFGIPCVTQLDDKACQFSISKGEHGRIIGSILNNVFYVVWLDPDHKLYKSKN